MKQLAACALLLLGVSAARAQVILNVNVTSANTIVITATGNGPVTSDSSHSYLDGIDLEGMFVPSGTGSVSVTGVSTLTTGDTSTGPIYDTAGLDGISEPSADLNLYQLAPPGFDVPQTFTFGLPAFSFGTSITVTFSGLVFSGIDYGVVTAGYSGDFGDGGDPATDFADAAVSTGSGVTAIGVYHVTGNAAPEPSTWAMILGSVFALAVIARRRLA